MFSEKSDPKYSKKPIMSSLFNISVMNFDIRLFHAAEVCALLPLLGLLGPCYTAYANLRDISVQVSPNYAGSHSAKLSPMNANTVSPASAYFSEISRSSAQAKS